MYHLTRVPTRPRDGLLHIFKCFLNGLHAAHDEVALGLRKANIFFVDEVNHAPQIDGCGFVQAPVLTAQLSKDF